MLAITRRKNEVVHIGPDIRIEVADIRGDSVRVGFSVPDRTTILRGELAKRLAVEAMANKPDAWKQLARHILARDEGRLCWQITALPTALGTVSVHSLQGTESLVEIQPRPSHCDRGNFLAKLRLTPGSNIERDIDAADGWPRYYFDLAAAKSECEAWMVKRGQLADSVVASARLT